jgi:hypothetical protein
VLVERVTGIGWRANGVLRAAGGDTRVLAPLSASIYVEAGGEILWLGPDHGTVHGRAIHVEADLADLACLAGDTLRVRHGPLNPWQPGPLPTRVGHLEAAAARLAADLAGLGTPRGFGAWLVGAALEFPLDAARTRADALAGACAADDAGRAADVAVELLGLGSGLTPSGDDLVGGAFFARALLARAGACDTAAWGAAAAVVRAAAPQRTHPISATLLGDLLTGEAWGSMHDLAAALAAADGPAARDSARRLTRLGHSSGWDLLAGFLAGCGV